MSEYKNQLDYGRQEEGFSSVWSSRVGLGFSLVAVSFVVAALAINAFITAPFWEPDLGAVSDHMAVLAMHNTEIDTIVMGSSHIGNGFVPQVFDDGNAEGAHPTSSYSFAIPGSAYADTLFSIESIADSQQKDLRYIVFEPLLSSAPNLAFFGGDSNAYSSRARQVYTPERTFISLRMALASSVPLYEKLNTAVSLLYVGSVRLLNSGVVSDILLGYKKVSRKLSVDELWAGRGHLSATDEASLAVPFENYYPSVDSGYRSLSDTEIDALRVVASQIRELGAEPILIFPPNRVEPGLEREIRDVMLREESGMRVLDSIFSAPPLSIYDEPQYWVDGRHLGLHGSIAYTRLLVEQWQNSFSQREEAN